MTPRPCFGCGHVHDPAQPGACWDARCLSTCPVCHPAAAPRGGAATR